MKALLMALCLLAACAAAAAGDDRKGPRPDFSGTWRIDRGKSDYGEWADKPLAKADSTLVVEHRDPELKIRRTLSLNGQEEVKDFAYYTDGRGETNQATLGVGEVRSKTRWDGDRVVSEAQLKRRGQGGTYELTVTQRWQVSSDGKTLTNTTSFSNELGAQRLKLVYRRADGRADNVPGGEKDGSAGDGRVPGPRGDDRGGGRDGEGRQRAARRLRED
ncbi:MAG TPA: hypothetical protein VN282_14120 [Pyrinomonadaceae bacterium]|nr:hypothetical protein [Pyrinomonadaceae bacterium]